MSNDAREIETKHIIENFRKIFDASHAINVSYHDDETIHVFVRRDDVCHAEFIMDVGSDDDEYRFVDCDNNFPAIVFETGY